MSEVTSINGSPVSVPVTSVSAPAVPAAPKSAIQIIEEQIAGFIKQREQAISNVHAIEGALQGAQHLIALLKNEAVKAEAFVKTEATKAVDAVENEAKKS